MIIAVLINIVLLIFSTLLGWLPDALVLPTSGGVNLDTYIASGIGYFHGLVGVFPPLGVISSAAIIYLTWKLIVLALKVILGHRVPVLTRE